MAVTTQNRNLLALNTIFSATDLLLNPQIKEVQANEITTQLKIASKYLMCYLRDEDIKNQFTPASEFILNEYNNASCSPIREFSNILSKLSDKSTDVAFLYAIPAFCDALAQKLLKTENESLQNILARATFAVCGNSPISNLAPQLLFISETLGLSPLEFIGDEKCEALAKALEEAYGFDADLATDTAYSVFHKTKVAKLLEYAENHQNKENSKKILENHSNTDPQIYVEDPFYAAKRERSVFVKGLQKYTLETLVLTKKFLDEHGLRFYLTEGTLLGAVRHNGFIPWDDDVDIAMPREDYDKLVELAKEGKIPPELNFDSLENNPKHWVLGAKMQLTRPTPYIQHKVTKLSACNGPYVDIFPLDYWNKPAGIKAWKIGLKIRIARRLIFIKTGYSKATKKKPERMIARLLLKLIRHGVLQKHTTKTLKNQYDGSHKYSVNLCSYYPYYKEIFLTSFFGEPVYVDFEGEKMPIPCEYDYMLKTVYGKNYDTIPPVAVTNMRKHAFELKTEQEMNN